MTDQADYTNVRSIAEPVPTLYAVEDRTYFDELAQASSYRVPVPLTQRRAAATWADRTRGRLAFTHLLLATEPRWPLEPAKPRQRPLFGRVQRFLFQLAVVIMTGLLLAAIIANWAGWTLRIAVG